MMARLASVRASLIMALCAAAPSAGLAAPAATPTAADWEKVARWPNLMGGIWGPEGNPRQAGGPAIGRDAPRPKLNANGEQLRAAARSSTSAHGSQQCSPRGIGVDVGGQFFYSAGTILLQSDLDYFVSRQIHMDRTTHGDPDPTYYGDSIGHWEGNTLVVDTSGILPEADVAPGVPNGGDMHVVERFELIAPGRIQQTETIEAPKVLAEPFVVTRMLVLKPEWSVNEVYCEQNNRDAPVDGRPNVNLEPPK